MNRFIVSLFSIIFVLNCCYADITISSIIPATGNTLFPTVITIYGTGFGSSGAIQSVSISGVACTIIGNSATQIKCTATPGMGSLNPVVVTNSTGAQNAAAFNYPFSVGTISDSTRLFQTTSTVNVGQLITIAGQNFSVDYLTDLNSAWTGVFELWVGNQRATITSHQEFQIIFLVPDYTGVNNRVLLNLNSPPANWLDTGITISYPAPFLSYAQLDDDDKRAEVDTVLIYGGHFGPAGGAQQIKIQIGDAWATHVVVLSDTQLTATVVSSGANQPIFLTLNNQFTTSNDVRIDLSDPSVSGLDCVPPFGAQDINNRDACNCFSGYAPLDPLLNVDCDLKAVCPGGIIGASSVAQYAPTEPTTTFANDHLYIYQSIPIVQNRRDTIIQFAIPDLGALTPNAGELGAETCWHPGTLWVKKLNELDCLDEFYGIIPWSQQGFCGFVEDVDIETTNKIYQSNLVTSFTEVITVNNNPHFRTISYAFLITVSFANQITVLLDTSVTVYIADPTDSAAIEVDVVNDLLYDPASKMTLVVFQTSFVWPYQINTSNIFANWTSSASVPGIVDVSTLYLSNPQPGSLVCDGTEDTECGQEWTLWIDTNPNPADPQVCNLAGPLTFSTGVLLCRDLYGAPSQICPGLPSTTFSLTISTTDLCDDAPAIDTNAQTQTAMNTFSDSGLENPQNVFQTGDWIYLQVVYNDPLISVDSITFNKISVVNADQTAADNLYTVFTPAEPVADAYTLAASAFSITQEVRQPGPIVFAGSNAYLGFQFRFLRNVLVNTTGTLSPTDNIQTVTIMAVLDVFYHGNSKRSVTASVTANAQSTINLYHIDEAVEGVKVEEVAQEEAEEGVLSLFASSSPFSTPSITFFVVSFLAFLLF